MLTKKNQAFLSWNVYQIYPKSFLDTNGDGIGDLAGVLEKLDYLKALGMDAIWLCPCYVSPGEDNGYDVADYRRIQPELGSLEDIRALIRGLHSRDMKLIMDLVPNHTSREHPWFQASRASRDNPFSDYYYWFDTPPNNWGSVFGGSAWEFDEVRGQYYLHSFAPGQPDLNWDNPQVTAQMQDIIDFWVDMGVDGFRVDVIDRISKTLDGENGYGPHLYERIQSLFGREKTAHLFTVGECWTDDLDRIRRCAGPDRLSTAFQFSHLDAGRGDKFEKRPGTLRDFWQRLCYWEEQTQANDLLYPLLTDNHDNGWLLSRIGSESLRRESATCLAAMVYLLRGICFLYQGQELGMVNSHHDSIHEFADVESIRKYAALCQELPPEEALARINFGSRDNPRRPMCWNGSETGGFTQGVPWLPFHSRRQEINLQADLALEDSVWRFYRDLLHLRKAHPALTVGTFQAVSSPGDNYCAYLRRAEDEAILVICNFEQAQTISLPGAPGKLLLSNYGLREKPDSDYRPYEIAVFCLAQ